MMGSLYLLLPLTVLFVLVIGAAFWWAIFAGQFDDIQSAANAVLADDDSSQSEHDGLAGKPVRAGLYTKTDQ